MRLSSPRKLSSRLRICSLANKSDCRRAADLSAASALFGPRSDDTDPDMSSLLHTTQFPSPAALAASRISLAIELETPARPQQGQRRSSGFCTNASNDRLTEAI